MWTALTSSTPLRSRHTFRRCREKTWRRAMQHFRFCWVSKSTLKPQLKLTCARHDGDWSSTESITRMPTRNLPRLDFSSCFRTLRAKKLRAGEFPRCRHIFFCGWEGNVLPCMVEWREPAGVDRSGKRLQKAYKKKKKKCLTGVTFMSSKSRWIF